MRQDFSKNAAVLSTSMEYLLKAQALQSQKQYGAAAKVLRAGVDAFPDEGRLYHALGKYYRAQYQDKEAMECFQTAHNLLPDDLYVRMDLAKFLTTRRLYDEAEKLYLEQYAIKADDVILLTAMGHMYQQNDNIPFAAACFGRALELNPHDRRARRRAEEVETKFRAFYTVSGWTAFQTHVATHTPHPPAADTGPVLRHG